jgi:P4 family phage/plasmid primase-like protien
MTVPYSTSDAVQFLFGWAPEGPWVLTSIVPDGGKTDTATFGPASVPQMQDWIEGRQGVQNIYFTVNRTSRAMNIKPKKTDIRAARAVHVDVDPRVGENPAEEKARAIKVLREYKPAPTVIIDSGNGAQGFWLLDGEKDTPDDAAREDVERRNLQIETLLQADACHNIDRIMRLPGTVNVPGAKKRAKGCVPVLASVVEVDWTRLYRLDAFPRAPEVVASAGTPAAGGRASARGRAPVVLSANLKEVWPDDLVGVSYHTKMLIVQGIDADDPNENRSEVVWHVCCQLVRAGCPDDVIAAVILDPDYKISGHVLDQPKPQRYAARQIERAREENPPPGPIVMPTALNLARAYREARRPHLLHYQQEFLEWDGAAYGAVADDAVRAGMWTFLETCRVEGEKGEEPKPLHPNSKVVSGAVDALKAVVHLSPPPDAARVLRWLDGRDVPDPAELVPSPGGVLNLRTGEVMPATPQLFARTALDFTPDPAAPQPELWLRFLGQVWPDDDDPACIAALQEFMGYLLTPDTRLQKALMMVGPPASGKGTILKVMARLVGLGNTTSPSMNSLSNGRFGLAPLLNKTLMTVGDMRIGPKTDVAALEENLLRITGEDRVSVDRKSISAVEVRLTARMAIATNELPRFNDSSGALARRLITLTQRQSFKDNPDMELEEKLARELPGILNWAMVGWRSVRDNKRITEPESSRVAARDLVDLASPVPEFVDDCCILGPFEVDKNELFETFRAWFKDRFGEEWRSGKVHFFKALYPCTPGVGDKNGSTPDGGRVKRVKGLKLNDFWAKGRIGGRASG